MQTIKNIAAYTQKTWGAEQRRAYIKNLDLTFLFLAENPMSGTPCDYIIYGLRKHSHESHTIFYENKDHSVFIIRILHKSIDVESQLGKPVRQHALIFTVYEIANSLADDEGVR